MLPMILLQPSDTAIFDTELNTANLLPQDATEPQVRFADLLRLGTELVEAVDLADGQGLPAGGNELPLELLNEAADRPAEGYPEMAVGLPVGLADVRPTVVAATVPAGESRAAGQVQLPPAPTIDIAVRLPVPPLQAYPLPASVAANTPAPAEALVPAVALPRDLAALSADVSASRAMAAERPAVAPEVVLARPPGSVPRDQALASVAAAVDSRLVTEQQRAPSPAVALPGTPEPVSRAVDAATQRSTTLTDRPRDNLQLTTAQSSSPQPTAQPVQAQVLPSGLNEVPAGQPVQPGSIQLTQAPEAAEARLAAPQTSLLLDVPVKDTAWGDQLGQRIQLMASHKLQSAEIRLTPAELGPLRVQVSVDDGVTNVTFHAQHAVTREAIEQALPRLRELLAESGLTLDQTHIGDPGLQREGRDGGHDASAAEFGGPDGLGNQDEVEMAVVPARTVTPDGLVDTFV